MAKKTCLKCGGAEDPSGMYGNNRVCWSCANELFQMLEDGVIYANPKIHASRRSLESVAHAYTRKQLFSKDTNEALPHQSAKVANTIRPDPKPRKEKKVSNWRTRKRSIFGDERMASPRIKGQKVYVSEDDEPDEKAYDDISTKEND